MSGRVEHFSRRRFLVGTATAGAAAATMSTLSPRAVAAPADRWRSSVPTLPSPVTPKAFIESITTVFQTLFRLPLYEAAYTQKPAVYVTSGTERKLRQWDNLTWDDHIGAARSQGVQPLPGRRDHPQPGRVEIKDASAHSIGLVGEASIWSILQLGNDFDNKGFDQVLNGPTSEQWLDPWVEHLRPGVTFKWGRHSRLTRNSRHIASATVVDPTAPPTGNSRLVVLGGAVREAGRGADAGRHRRRPQAGQRGAAAPSG